jgi:hypothetical protein
VTLFSHSAWLTGSRGRCVLLNNRILVEGKDRSAVFVRTLWDNVPKRSRKIPVAFFSGPGLPVLLVGWRVMLPLSRIRAEGRGLPKR